MPTFPNNITTDNFPQKLGIFLHDPANGNFRLAQVDDFGGGSSASGTSMNDFLAAISGNTANISLNVDTLEVNTDQMEGLLQSGVNQVTGDLSKNVGPVQMAVARSGTPPQVGNNVVTPVWFNQYGEQIIAGYSLSQDALEVIDVAPAVKDYALFPEKTFTASPGIGLAHDVSDMARVNAQIDVSSLDTNVTGKIQFSLDEDLFYDAIIDNTAVAGATVANNAIVISQSGTFGISAVRQGKVARVYLNGGNSTVVATVMAGR